MYLRRMLAEQLTPALILLALFTVICGLAYPLAMTALAATLFPRQAAGSLVEVNGVAVGSELLGQSFSRPEYFWGRPSATIPQPCNGAASSGSNLSPANPALAAAVSARIQKLRAADTAAALPVPADLVTASGSGLDPHLSPAAVLWQLPRVARARGMDEQALRQLVTRCTERALPDCIGEARVNILMLNIALDRGGQ